jgi:hypothetical protein
MLKGKTYMMEYTKMLENKVQAVCERKHITRHQFLGECVKAGISYDTAVRLYNGETGFTMTTLATVAGLFKVQVSDLIDTKRP